MTAPLVVSIVLNWNNFDDTEDCVCSLQDITYSSHETIIVDNGSTDGSAMKLNDRFKHISVIELEDNRGFGGGMNAGIRVAKEKGAEFIWLLNNDVIINEGDVLDRLVGELNANVKLGAISPIIEREDGGIWFSKGDINWKNGNATHIQTRQSDGVFLNDYIPICATLYPAWIFDEVGLLPEDYFLYYEDVKHAIQISEAGYNLGTNSDTHVIHKGTSSSGGSYSPTFSYYNSRNRLLFINEFRDELGKSAYPEYFVWVSKKATERIVKRKGGGTIAILKGMVDGLLNKRGKGPYPS